MRLSCSPPCVSPPAITDDSRRLSGPASNWIALQPAGQRPHQSLAQSTSQTIDHPSQSGLPPKRSGHGTQGFSWGSTPKGLMDKSEQWLDIWVLI